MQDLVGLIKDDWQRIPATIRYVFYGGLALIILAWLGDHWNDPQQYHLPLLSNNEQGFQIGCGLVIAVFILLVAKQIWVFRTIWDLRRRYPVKQLGIDFHLVNFKENWIYIIDLERKKRFHVRNPATIRDLDFMALWEDVTVSKDEPPDTEIMLKNGEKIRLGDYPVDPRNIHTQDK